MVGVFTPPAPHGVLLVKSSCQTFWQQQFSRLCFFLSYGGKQYMRNKSTSHDRPGVGFLTVLGGGEYSRRKKAFKIADSAFCFYHL